MDRPAARLSRRRSAARRELARGLSIRTLPCGARTAREQSGRDEALPVPGPGACPALFPGRLSEPRSGGLRTSGAAGERALESTGRRPARGGSGRVRTNGGLRLSVRLGRRAELARDGPVHVAGRGARLRASLSLRDLRSRGSPLQSPDLSGADPVESRAALRADAGLLGRVRADGPSRSWRPGRSAGVACLGVDRRDRGAPAGARQRDGWRHPGCPVRERARPKEGDPGVAARLPEGRRSPVKPVGKSADATVLDRLFEIVTSRRDARPPESYVVSLLDGGWEAMAAKIREEAEEVAVAAREEGDEALAHEVADLIFHVWVVLADRL